MICEYCHEREATTAMKQTVNGESKQLHLCAHCANSMLFSNFFSDFNLSNIFGKAQTVTKTQKVCPKCQSTLQQVVKAGKLGCGVCYQTFESDLARSIEKIHGKSTHIGKVPHSAAGSIKRKNQITEYKMQLNRMIAEQEFEKAAEIRDKIKELEGSEDE